MNRPTSLTLPGSAVPSHVFLLRIAVRIADASRISRVLTRLLIE